MRACAHGCGQGHCNRHAGTCIRKPGTYGVEGDKLSLFDTEESPLNGTVPAHWTRAWHKNTGSKKVLCPGVQRSAAQLRAELGNWLRTSKAGGRPCFANCSGRGVCNHGWCECRAPGAFGIDCAHGNSSKRSTPTGLAIYVYELPPDLGFNFGRRTDPIYRAEDVFLQQLLADQRLRALDPEHADLFFVPMHSVYGIARNQGCDRSRLELITKYLRTNYPWWDRHGGRDHIFFLTIDRGGCGLGEAGRSPIIMMHFGLLGPFSRMRTIALGEENVGKDEPHAERLLAAGEW